MKEQLLVISGPSGSGKSTLINRLMKYEKDIYFSISCTTRPKRDGEKDGVDYHYISEDEFKKGNENGDFLEWAVVHKNYYGTSLVPVKEALKQGKTVIFDIDVQGFKSVREAFKNEIVSIFITTKNKTELKKRLIARGTNDPDDIERRIMNAVGEMEHIKEYDYLIINDDLDESYRAFKSIFRAIKFRSTCINLRAVVDDWIY